MGDEVPLSEVCACYARLPGDESEMTVVQVFDDGIGPGLVQSWMRLVRIGRKKNEMKLVELTKTCSAYPEQYEGLTGAGSTSTSGTVTGTQDRLRTRA